MIFVISFSSLATSLNVVVKSLSLSSVILVCGADIRNVRLSVKCNCYSRQCHTVSDSSSRSSD